MSWMLPQRNARKVREGVFSAVLAREENGRERRQYVVTLINPEGKICLHTHTAFSDGKDEPEELVREALDLGIETLGFSDHQTTPFDLTYCIQPGRLDDYREEILRLKKKYEGKIDIRLGIEKDYYGEKDDFDYDFVIGGVHYIEKDGNYLSVDESEEVTREQIDTYFGGDVRAYVKAYYETVAGVAEKTGCDIVAHLDLISKFNEGGTLFDEESVWYRRLANAAVAHLAKSHPIIEINTGAMARGYRKTPYPADFLIREAGRLGLQMILSSDCHDKTQLTFGFDEIRKAYEAEEGPFS